MWATPRLSRSGSRSKPSTWNARNFILKSFRPRQHIHVRCTHTHTQACPALSALMLAQRSISHYARQRETRGRGWRERERERGGGARYTHALLVLYLRSCTPGESKQARMKSRNPFVARARVHLVSLGSEFQFINENFIGTGVGYARGKYVCVQCMRWR